MNLRVEPEVAGHRQHDRRILRTAIGDEEQLVTDFVGIVEFG